MTREEAIQELQNCKGLIKQDGQDYLDERDIPLLDMAIEALQFAEHFDLLKEFQSLQEVVRCKDCKHRQYHEGLNRYYCEMFYGQGDVSDENYCQWGERREP